MSLQPHYIIIGAGLLGLSTADALMTRGMRVSVFDKHSGPAQGASFCNSGMLHSSQAWPWSVERGLDTDENITDRDSKDPLISAISAISARSVYDLAQKSNLLMIETCRRLGFKVGMGCFQMFGDDAALQRAKERFEFLGVPCETRVQFKCPALYFPEDQFGDAYRYCCKLEADLRARGVSFHYGVDDIDIILSKDRVIGVSFATPLYDKSLGDGVIIAGGTGSAVLAERVGIHIPLMAVRGYAVNFNRPDIGLFDAALPDAPVMDSLTHSALTVFKHQVRLSGTVGQKSSDRLLERWWELVPEMMSALREPVSEWTGERPMSLLGRPFVSATDINGLWVNTGHGHMGWSLCAASGALMADIVLDEKSDARFALSLEPSTLK